LIEEESVFNHILLPTDGTELSERAVLAASEFAISVNARVIGIHVVSSPEQLEHETKARPKGVLDFVEGTAKDYGVPCECLYVTGGIPSRKSSRLRQRVVVTSYGWHPMATKALPGCCWEVRPAKY
jgi:nucleotide-binding universal stress UspA family protein